MLQLLQIAIWRATWSPHSGHVFHIGYKPLTAAIGQTDTAAAAEIASH